MIKLKDLIDGDSSAPKRVDESLAISERSEVIKLKDLLFERQPSQSMTTDQKNRLISKIHGYERDRLTRMLRSAAKLANSGDARAQDLALIYHNELNNRDRMGYGGL